jgi:hypothetical protein
LIVSKGPNELGFRKVISGRRDYEDDEFLDNDLKLFLSTIKSWTGQDRAYLKNTAELGLLVLSTSLNHWLPGSHMLSLLKHLQVFVTTILLESTSRQTESFPTLDERCILESDMASHFELGSEQIILSLAGFPNPSACKQK